MVNHDVNGKSCDMKGLYYDSKLIMLGVYVCLLCVVYVNQKGIREGSIVGIYSIPMRFRSVWGSKYSPGFQIITPEKD